MPKDIRGRKTAVPPLFTEQSSASLRYNGTPPYCLCTLRICFLGSLLPRCIHLHASSPFHRPGALFAPHRRLLLRYHRIYPAYYSILPAFCQAFLSPPNTPAKCPVKRLTKHPRQTSSPNSLTKYLRCARPGSPDNQLPPLSHHHALPAVRPSEKHYPSEIKGGIKKIRPTKREALSK